MPPWEAFQQPQQPSSAGPWTAFASPSGQPDEAAAGAANKYNDVRDFSSDYQEERKAGGARLEAGLAGLKEAATGPERPRLGPFPAEPLDVAAADTAAGAVQYLTSPITAAYRSVVGRPGERYTGIPKEYIEAGAQLATPGLGFTRFPKGPPPVVRPPAAAPMTAGQEVAEAGQRLGIELPRAATSDTAAVQQTGKVVSNIPIAGTPLRKASEAAIADLGAAAEGAKAAYGSGSPQAAGAAAREGITENLKSGPIKQRVTELYDRVDNLVNPVVTGELPNTRMLVNTINARRTNAALPTSSAVGELETALSRQGMNYEGVKDLRTYFGEMRDGNIPIPQGMTSEEVKQIYGSLTKDMRGIVAKAGGPEGLRAWEQANHAAARWAGIRQDLGKLLKIQNEEAIFDKIAGMAGSTSRADISLLGRVRGAVGPQNWDEVASAVIGKMGFPPGGTGFSPDQFLTAYNKLSPEGRRMLFRSTDNASHANAIDDIAKVSERFKQLNKFSNPSGTGQTVAGFSELSGLFMEPLTTISTVVGGRVLSHILARPAPARAMANWSKDYAAVAEAPTRQNMNKFEASTKVFAATVGRDFNRTDLVPDLIRRLQGSVPAAADNEQAAP